MSSPITESEKQLSGNVLVVDDNEINRFIIKKLLAKWGITPDFAENGQVAVDKVEAKQYDVVLMDIHMPVLNGIEATGIIRQSRNGQFKKLPIIALTASVMQNDIDEISKSGMTDYISKPFVPAELHAKLATILEEEKKD